MWGWFRNLWRRQSPWPPFKPCVIWWPEVGATEMILEDTMIVWQPWGPYQGHAVDLGYSENGRLVGIKIWDNIATIRLPDTQSRRMKLNEENRRSDRSHRQALGG